MIYVIILLAFAHFFFTPPPFSSPPSFSFFPHCVHLCNCVLHKGIRSALMRNCNCFFSLALWICSRVCVDICAGDTDWQYVLNECALVKGKWIQFWNNMFFSLPYLRTIGMKTRKVWEKTMLWNTFLHNNELKADTEQWKHNQPRLQLPDTIDMFSFLVLPNFSVGQKSW